MHGAALWGFVGTLAGAVIGAAAAIVSTIVLQRREDRRADRQRARDALEAFRAVEVDLVQAKALLEACSAVNSWWRTTDEMVFPLWREHSGPVSSTLDRADWQAVAITFSLIRVLATSREIAIATAGPGHPGALLTLEVRHADMVKKTVQACDKAIAVIRDGEPTKAS